MAKAVQGFYNNRRRTAQGRSDLDLINTDPLAASPAYYPGPVHESELRLFTNFNITHHTKDRGLETLMSMMCSVVTG